MASSISAYTKGSLIGGLTGGGLIFVLFSEHGSMIIDWLANNFGASIIAFFLVSVAFFWFLAKLSEELKNKVSASQIAQTEAFIDFSISAVLGIGVIWTAIGMRSALMFGLSHAEDAMSLGPFALLERLVEGGILTALTTTIVGGVLNYLFRFIKHFVVGHALEVHHMEEIIKSDQDIRDDLSHIRAYLKILVDRSTPSSPSSLKPPKGDEK